jgi:DNA-binding NtrC family response regulator
MASRILIVDDEPVVVELLRDILDSAGYETTGVTTFEEGRRLLREDPPPDVLVTDVRLGSYNGLQLVLLRRPATGAVVISGYWDHTLDDEARRLGSVYLLKPVPAEQLLESVQRALDRRIQPAHEPH